MEVRLKLWRNDQNPRFKKRNEKEHGCRGKRTKRLDESRLENAKLASRPASAMKTLI